MAAKNIISLILVLTERLNWTEHTTLASLPCCCENEAEIVEEAAEEEAVEEVAEEAEIAEEAAEEIVEA